MGKSRNAKKQQASRNSGNSLPKGKQRKTQTRQTRQTRQARQNVGLTFSALYIIVAFAFAIAAFLLGRAQLTSNFPILENFYGILPSFVIDLSDNILDWLNLADKSDSHSFRKETKSNDTNDENANGMNGNANSIQPLTKSKISIDATLMATSYHGSELDNAPNLKCDIENWLMRGNVSLPGYHVLCVETSGDDSNGRSIKYHRNGVYHARTSKQFIFDAFNSFASLRVSLEKVLKIQRTDKKRLSIPQTKDRWLQWAMYDQYGRAIDEENMDKLFYGIILIFEVGLFQYPPIELGFERPVLIRNMNPDSVARQPYLPMTLTTLSLAPVVLDVSGFLAPEYCDYIISDSSRFMRKSTVSHMHNTQGDANQWRTSSTHWLKSHDPIVHVIDCQTASLTHLPLPHQENVQVLRYFEGEQYDSHWDYFDPKLYKGTDMEQKIRGGRNRFLTLFWYMSDVTDGGWTYFPMAHGGARPSSFKLKAMDDCRNGLKVEPKKGHAIIFYSMRPDGNVDPKSLHGACPVGPDQVKWGANKWIWTRPVASR